MTTFTPFRHHFRLKVVRLPQGKGIALGGKVSVFAVFPKAAKPEKQRMIVLWFERVKGGWRPINVRAEPKKAADA